MHVLSLSLSLFPPLVLVLSSFVASQTHLLGPLSCAIRSALFFVSFHFFIPFTSYALYISHIYLTSELKLRIKTSLNQQQQQHQLELLL